MNEIVLLSQLKNPFDEELAKVFVREQYRVFAIGELPVSAGTQVPGVTLLSSELPEAVALLEKEAGRIDYFLDLADERDKNDTFTVVDGINREITENIYRENVLKPMAMLEAFITLLDKGEGKRLFYLTSARASINETRDTSGYAYNLSKAALHQFLQMVRNKLAPSGYTFRVFDPMNGSISTKDAAEGAYHYIVRKRGSERGDPLRNDEDNLVFRDAEARQHAW